MRLTAAQQRAIRETATAVYGADAQVTLFGSRVNDQQKGGDIDLLICVSRSYQDALALKFRFLAQLKRQIGDRRIDVVLETPDAPSREIVRIARSEGAPIS